MRFTVKAKLASAFGIIIALSMVAGGVAYVKLGDMMATADSMVLRAKRMEKALGLGADALILDLEDSVSLERKAEARAASADFLKSQTRRTVALFVRINPLDSDLVIMGSMVGWSHARLVETIFEAAWCRVAGVGVKLNRPSEMGVV